MPHLSAIWTAPRRRLDPLLVKIGVSCLIVSITGGSLTVSGIAIASPTAAAGEVGLAVLGVLLLGTSAFSSVEGAPAGEDDRPPLVELRPTGGWLATLPPRSPCFGRETILEELVPAVLASPPRPTPVLGPPGVGKTTITVAMLHDRRVQRRFGNRRCFVRCESATTSEALLTEIAAAIGLPIAPDLRPRVMAALTTAPALLVLDNAETPWAADTLATEELFLALASIPRLALVASLRGTQRPGGGVWRPAVHVLPLPEHHARALFLEVAGATYADDADLTPLLAELEGLPLAVELLAHAAEGEPDLATLRRRWSTERARMLHRGSGAHRLLSLAVSLELSITGPLMSDDGRRLLSLLGVLPDGISHEDLAPLLPGSAEPAASTLRKVGLAFDERGRLRCLAPIRDHVATSHPPASDDLGRAVTHYAALAAALGSRVGSEGGADAVTRLVAESANLEGMILAGLSGENPRPAIQASLALGELIRFTGSGSTRIPEAARAAARALADTALEADCIKGLGDLALARSDPEGARAGYEEALPLYRRVGDVLGEANCIWGLGDIARERSDHEGARARYEEALRLYQRIPEPYSIGWSYRRLARLAATPADRARLRQAAEDAWASIGRDDLVRDLREEFAKKR